MLRTIAATIAAVLTLGVAGVGSVTASSAQPDYTDGADSITAAYGSNRSGFTVFWSERSQPIIYPARRVALRDCDGNTWCRNATLGLYLVFSDEAARVNS